MGKADVQKYQVRPQLLSQLHRLNVGARFTDDVDREPLLHSREEESAKRPEVIDEERANEAQGRGFHFRLSFCSSTYTLPIQSIRQ